MPSILESMVIELFFFKLKFFRIHWFLYEFFFFFLIFIDPWKKVEMPPLHAPELPEFPKDMKNDYGMLIHEYVLNSFSYTLFSQNIGGYTVKSEEIG